MLHCVVEPAQMIRLCPNIQHLRLVAATNSGHVSSSAIDCIRETLGRKLYSLDIEHRVMVSAVPLWAVLEMHF